MRAYRTDRETARRHETALLHRRSAVPRMLRRMPDYALWPSIKHYMVAGSPPARTADSRDALDRFAREQGWVHPAPAVIAEKRGDDWWPIVWVRRHGPKPLTPDQTIKYAEVREGRRRWPNHLGEPPTRL